ncbi:MAG: hypothetical protein JW966_09580 [Anaerolineae bacterium]|nr:hypothetical protein [Anaerolineae bacterium]
MYVSEAQVGRVIRVGRGWVDVTVNRKVRRLHMHPDLLVRAGSYVQILNGQSITVLSAGQKYADNLI